MRFFGKSFFCRVARPIRPFPACAPQFAATRHGVPPMSSLEKMLKVIDAFSEEAPVWTVDRLVEGLGTSRSTTYRYVKELCEAGFLAPVGGGGYILGPRIIELDRQIRHCDPMLTLGRDLVSDILPQVGEGIIFICGLVGDNVISVYRRENPNSLNISYSRGRPMPLFRGSASRVILAHLPERRAMKLFLYHRREIREAGLGSEWDAFRVNMWEIREQPYLSSRAQVDRGVFALSAPVFDGDGNILASLTLAIPEQRADREDMDPLARVIVDGAARLGAAIAALAVRAGAGRVPVPIRRAV
ncbi:MAG: IclR family transcriptional regulator [Alphaproteobacteria bacterium]|nr:MAG: IclR family transcriptional regulator [Alphaproteobacteria bacterium]